MSYNGLQQRESETDRMQNHEIVVSFCIPVYNNALAAEAIVKELLRCEDSRFEVIVSDDNSCENVEELLSKIHDSRLRYYRNEKNLGAHKNWEHTLELGQGEWLYLVMGRDRLHGEEIPKLIDILENARSNGIVYIKDGYTHGGYKFYSKKKNNRVYSGVDAMIEFVRVEHPTGDIYRREIFLSVKNRDRYFSTSDMYPEARLKFDMLLKGKGKFVTSGVHIYGEENSRYVDFAKTKSGVENDKNIFDAYYAPRRSTLQAFELIDMMDVEFPGLFTENEADKFFSAKFRELLMFITLFWYSRCGDYGWSSHYGHSPRYVSSFEMIGNVITAYKSTKSHLQENGKFTKTRQMIMLVKCANTIAKCIMFYPFKRALKKTIQVLGLWDFISRIKRKVHAVKKS